MTATATKPVRPARVDDLIPVRGIADIEDGRGYLRTAGYRRSPADIPLPAALVRTSGLRRGDMIEGTRGKGAGATIADVTLINGLTPGAARSRARSTA